MFKKKLIGSVAITFLAALAFSSTAFADSEEPQVPLAEVPNLSAAEAPTVQPADPAAITVEAPIAEPTVAPSEPAAEAPVLVDAQPADPIAVAVAPTEPTAETPVVAEAPAVVETAPVVGQSALVETAAPTAEAPVLVDASGEPLVLASQASADLINSGDPYWFVGAQEYATVKLSGTCPPGTIEGTTCWVNAGLPITEALNRIETGLLPTDRKLYVLFDTYTEDINIDGSSLGDAIKSQLNGIIGNPDGTGIPTLNGNVTLSHLTGGFTLSGFIINGGFSLTNSSNTVLLKDLKVRNISGTGKGIIIGDNVTSHVGSVTLQNVVSSSNNQNGALLYVASGSLKISSSSFDFNNNDGLLADVHSGAITMDGVSASSNFGYGGYIPYFGKPLLIKNSTFSDNTASSDGLSIIGDSSAPAMITLDTVYALGNDIYGLDLKSYGGITLNNVRGNTSKYKSGAYLNNLSKAAVKVSNSFFYKNDTSATAFDGIGLEIVSLGPVTLTSIRAEENHSYGVHVDNCQFVGSACTGTGSVILTSPATGGSPAANGFDDNGSHGIAIETGGSITLTNLYSSSNDVGIYLSTINGNGSVTINKTLPDWYNDISNNGEDGISVHTNGSITISGTWGTYNGENGFTCDSTSKNVTISSGQYSHNAWYGLYISGTGNVTLMDVEASHNDTNRADTNYYDGAVISNTTGSVTIKSSATTARYNFSDNTSSGLNITTNGNVSISNIAADKNGFYGLYLTSGPGTVSVARSDAGSNGEYGFALYAYGNTTLDTVTADSNGSLSDYSGAYVYLCHWDGVSTCLNNATFTLKGTGSHFDDNTEYGLYVSTKGTISLSNVSAASNYYEGISVNNSYPGSVGNVSIGSTGGYWNTLEDNNTSLSGIGGLYVSTYGTITLARMNVSGNHAYGALLDNHGSVLPKAVTLTDSTFNSNESYGLYLNVSGTVTLRGVSASYNSPHNGQIATVGNSTGGTTVYDRLTSDIDGDRWWFTGTTGNTYHVKLNSSDFDAYLELYSEDGTLIASDDNSGGGTNAYFNSTFPTTGTYYLKVSSKDTPYGNYTLMLNDDANANIIGYLYINGATIYNTSGSAGVTVTNTPNVWPTFNENNSNGLYISSNGAVSLSNISASKNYWDGVDAETQGNVSATNNSTATRSEFNLNGTYGLRIQTAGTILVSNHIIANQNGFNGISLDNTSALTAKAVTVGTVTANSNSSDGLEIYSNGAITLSNIVAQSNASNGIDATNNYIYGAAVSLSGSNFLRWNGLDGLYMLTDGTVSVSGVLAEGNSGDGILVQDGGLGKTVLVKSSTTQLNIWHGVQITEAHGKITLNTVKAFYNGIGTNLDGVNLNSNNNDVLVQSCVFMANEGDGIEANIGSGILTVTGSSITGNDTNNNGDLNIYVH